AARLGRGDGRDVLVDRDGCLGRGSRRWLRTRGWCRRCRRRATAGCEEGAHRARPAEGRRNLQELASPQPPWLRRHRKLAHGETLLSDWCPPRSTSIEW